ncbi:MAG TPA: DMT family transporter [Candidatus Eisenbergiella stercorigallinarum]|uniref:DMT family transporter n=1 Tax=Candidatus Eisenbergiella stercorigallinarum TaxID=2838557 RepID=A0A9D2U1V8_9FIRM|nr:DMT family transporter [Candidatus Eisenbergiella stercorigallinarum]
MWGLIIALLSGALMSVQGVFNTQVTKASGIWAAGCFVQLSALLVSLAAWAISERSPFSAVLQVQPKYMLLGGAIGAFITYTVIKSMDMLGPARAVMLIVVAQLLVAYLIELFGMFGVEKVAWDWRKAVGMAFAIAGIVVFKWEPGK